MIRSDREITDRDEIVAVMKKCDSLTLALNDTDGWPYAVKLNFGLDIAEDGTIRIYFHSASAGHKLELIRRDDRAAFEMDCEHRLQYFPERGYCTMAYESAAGRGRVRVLDEDEKPEALAKIMRQYHPEGEAPFNPAAMPRTTVCCLTVEAISGKRKLPK